MKIINTVKRLRCALDEMRAAGNSIGFVPTMGALHEGHLSLVKQCAAESDVCIVSIFVNPAQFNDPKDLASYPRTVEADCAMLESAGCSIVFVPAVEEIYPAPDLREFDLGSLVEVMEGRFRPGHFQGVAKVVSRLFDIVGPCRAYFGLKDFQQLAVIRRLVDRLGMSVGIVACPIVREADGLAMSSRNMRLSAEERAAAPEIFRALRHSRELAPSSSLADVVAFVGAALASEPLLRLEYFEIVHPVTLMPLRAWSDSDEAGAVGCIAVYCGEVRLIDNITYRN
ncbi:MAG: pantoate--beta-alanine ligase [Tannerellaceae bacterium]|jgi:pantoate--beta-alanine ligase|nr:pantoate--beta-alanine ligase [Tannerellaceae bacterium]